MRRRVAAAVVLIFALATFESVAAPRYSGWGTPTNLGALVNSSASDNGPAFSKDGLTLYFTSTRAGGHGGEDLWVSQRATSEGPWGAATNLGPPIDTAANERVPTLSRDQHWLFFGSTRPGGFGSYDIWASWRDDVHDAFGWQEPINLGPNINGDGADLAPAIFEDQDGTAELYFNSTRLGGPDLFLSVRGADGAWGQAVPLTQLNTVWNDSRPAIRHDGLELLFMSDRPGTLGGLDIWVTTRTTTDDPWSAPENLGPPVNTQFDDLQVCISSDGESLIFASTKPGGSGAGDLYVSTRSKQTGKPQQ